VIALIFWYKVKHPIYAEITLPKEWWWDNNRIKEEGYLTSKNSGELPYWSKEVNQKHQSKELEFFNELKEGLDFGVIIVEKCWAIVSPILASNVSAAWSIQKSRLKDNSPDNKFNSKSWKEKDPDNRRQRIIDSFNNTCKHWPWNASLESKDGYVVPVCHGTEENIAWKIASVGFANLSLTDVGFYGKGIYFSSSASYTVPYFSNTKRPAILICFIIPGNPFPVNEHPKDEINHSGQPIQLGYQSHYVVTTPAGFPLKLQEWNNQQKHYDELIISQETQVVPIFLIRVSTTNMNAVLSLYNQSVLATKDEPPAIIENDEEEPLLGKQSDSDDSSSNSDDDKNVRMKDRRVNERIAQKPPKRQ
jgi:hypothetical protein